MMCVFGYDHRPIQFAEYCPLIVLIRVSEPFRLGQTVMRSEIEAQKKSTKTKAVSLRSVFLMRSRAAGNEAYSSPQWLPNKCDTGQIDSSTSVLEDIMIKTVGKAYISLSSS